MEQENARQSAGRASVPEPPSAIPPGYRSGIITAITVILGFALLFLRTWVFELPGEWTIPSVIAAGLLLAAILLNLVALWRALQLKDEQAREYGTTLRWFVASIAMLIVSLIVAGISYADVHG